MAKFSFLKHMGASVYTDKHGELIIRKIGIDAKRIKTDPAYKRTRENGAIFGRAAKAGKLIRQAFMPWLRHMKNASLTGRLVKVLMTVLHSDTINDRAGCNLLDGDLTLLQDFECNDKKPYPCSANPFVFGFLKEKKQVKLKMKSFDNDFSDTAPDSAHGIKAMPVMVAISIEENRFQVFTSLEAKPVDVHSKWLPATEIQANITLQSPFIVIAALSVEFSQTINGQIHPVAPSKNMLRFMNVFRG